MLDSHNMSLATQAAPMHAIISNKLTMVMPCMPAGLPLSHESIVTAWSLQMLQIG